MVDARHWLLPSITVGVWTLVSTTTTFCSGGCHAIHWDYFYYSYWRVWLMIMMTTTTTITMIGIAVVVVDEVRLGPPRRRRRRRRKTRVVRHFAIPQNTFVVPGRQVRSFDSYVCWTYSTPNNRSFDVWKCVVSSRDQLLSVACWQCPSSAVVMATVRRYYSPNPNLPPYHYYYHYYYYYYYYYHCEYYYRHKTRTRPNRDSHGSLEEDDGTSGR